MSDNSRDGEERSAKRAKATGGLAVLGLGGSQVVDTEGVDDWDAAAPQNF